MGCERVTLWEQSQTLVLRLRGCLEPFEIITIVLKYDVKVGRRSGLSAAANKAK